MMAYEDEEKKQYMVIKIKKPHHAERLAWIVLVAFLITVIFYQWLSWPDGDGSLLSEQLNAESLRADMPTDATEKDTSETALGKGEEKPIMEKITEKTETTSSGRIEIAITKVGIEKKGNDFGKLLSIAYSLDNQKADFVPLLRFFLYDAQWTEELYSPAFVSRCCEQQPLLNLPLKSGAPKLEKTFYPNNGNGFSVSNLTETKTVVMEVYDKDNSDTLLAATEYTLKNDVWK